MKVANTTDLEPGMVMTRELAQEEVNGYLSFKRIRPKRRIEKKDYIDSIVDGVEDGTLSIHKETKVITHRLLHPTGGIKKFEYVPRISQSKIAARLKMSSNDESGHSAITCFIAELTGNNITVVGMLDTEDNVVASAIALLFM